MVFTFMWPQTLPPACLLACETATSNCCPEQEGAKWALSHSRWERGSLLLNLLGVLLGNTRDQTVPLLPPHGWAGGCLCFQEKFSISQLGINVLPSRPQVLPLALFNVWSYLPFCPFREIQLFLEWHSPGVIECWPNPAPKCCLTVWQITSLTIFLRNCWEWDFACISIIKLWFFKKINRQEQSFRIRHCVRKLDSICHLCLFLPLLDWEVSLTCILGP